MKRYFLVGYMGSGKTTIGRRLAEVLNLDFIDIDNFIEARYQKSVSQIFNEYGEEHFRKIETNVLRELGEFENVLIATGGGTPCFNDNMLYMNEQGMTIYLKASIDTLSKRLIKAKSKRPLIANLNDIELTKFVQTNLAKREIIYNQATIIHETDEVENVSDINTYVNKLKIML